MSVRCKSNATAGIIFPSAATCNINNNLRQIGKATVSVRNRLSSIESDAEFVSSVKSQLALPLIANERCGSWYVKPDLKAASAYFKSTDGHFGQWSMSLRRLNLNVLDIVGQNEGCIIVDSTRRGKHLPDALSKTVPIWCAVMNKLLFPDAKSWHHVQRLPELISDSEYSSISSRLDSFADQVRALDLDLVGMRKKVKRPMQIIWIARSLHLLVPTMPPPEVEYGECYPVVLCMASVVECPVTPQLYIQGAADDCESWSSGLTPEIFWSYREKLLCTSENDIRDSIRALIKENSQTNLSTGRAAVMMGSIVSVGTLHQNFRNETSGSLVITCSSGLMNEKDGEADPKHLHLNCGAGKQGSRDLRREVAKILDFLEGRHIETILICCNTGKDISVGVALAILALYSDDGGFIQPPLHRNERVFNKELIRKKLSWIMASIPSANPSRATLNAVNSFLMNRPT